MEFHLNITSTDEGPVEALCAVSGLSRQRVKRAMDKGAVWLRRGAGVRRLRRKSSVLRPGDELHLYYDEKVLGMRVAAARLVADAGGYSVWHKPYGMWSQGSKWGDHCSLGRWAEKHLCPPRPSFIVHRLDRAATGLMLLAHSKGGAAALSRMFREREVDKRYRVVVQGVFPPGEMELHTVLDRRPAHSRVRRLETDAKHGRSLLEVRLDTGRKHQIRRQLAELGHPLVGDRLYGGTAAEGVDLQLTAFRLAFRCPLSGEDRVYELPTEDLPTLRGLILPHPHVRGKNILTQRHQDTK